MVEEKNQQNELNKIDEIYDGDLSFENQIENPILNPIAEVYTLYESNGLSIKKDVTDFDIIQTDINEFLKKNATYSGTLIVGKIIELKAKASDIIHRQDMQIANLKRVINDMVKLSDKFKSKIEKKEIFPMREMEFISKSNNKKEIKEEKIKKEEIKWDQDEPILMEEQK